jgi:hypothetical protein
MSPDFEDAISYITPRIVTAVDRHPEDRELRQVLEMLAALTSGAPAPTSPREAFPPVALDEQPRGTEAGDPTAALPADVAGFGYEHLRGPRAGGAR